jgi:hypothetical protein
MPFLLYILILKNKIKLFFKKTLLKYKNKHITWKYTIKFYLVKLMEQGVKSNGL